jgi:anthranilate synthase/aminodeoxychorismate synthase-like glutamine amidotransferase
MVLIIDNYDSFTFNLVQYLGELGADVRVLRNDELTVEGIEAMAPSHLVLSPGPCTPNEAGITLQSIERLAGRIPILGVCLGHQAIGQAFGGKVVRAKQVMHGKTSRIRHDGAGVFSRILARLPGDQRPVGGWRDHGAAAPQPRGRRGAISSGSAAHPARAQAVTEFSNGK